MSSPGVWNYDLLQTHFLSQDVESIVSIPLAAGRGGDTAIWHDRKDGKYTVKSGYRLTMDLHNVATAAGEACCNGSECGNSVWSKIWRLKVANKIKNFLWRDCNNFLPCTFSLFRKVMPQLYVWDVGMSRSQLYMLYRSANRRDKSGNTLFCIMSTKFEGNQASWSFSVM